MSNVPAKVQPEKRTENLRTMLEANIQQLRSVAQKHLKPDRIVKLLLATCSRNPKLLECTPESVLKFCVRCSETGMEPIGAGGAYPVPFWNRKANPPCLEMQFIPDYRGMANVAKDAGCIKDAWAEVVYEHDFYECELGMEPKLIHKPAKGLRGAHIAAYCILVMPDGSKRFAHMDADEIRGIRARSKSADDGPWVTDEAQMFCKTVMRRAMKQFAGKSRALDAATAADDEVHGLVITATQIAAPTPEELPEGTPSGSSQPPADSNPGQQGGDDVGPDGKKQEEGFPDPRKGAADQGGDPSGSDGSDDSPVVRGKITVAIEKLTKNGTKFWSIRMKGENYSTFDGEIGADAIRAKAEGKEVILERIKKGEYYNVAKLTVVE